MPSVNDIVTIAEALEKSPLVVIQSRCLAVRNRNSTCRKCVAACSRTALEVSRNEITLKASACIACGACATACPTGAIAPIEPTDAELAESAAQALPNTDGTAVFACARMAGWAAHRFEEIVAGKRIIRPAYKATFVDPRPYLPIAER